MTAPAPSALTRLTDDELLLRASVREFAEAQIRPRGRELDDQAHIPRTLIDQLFALGVMGIEVPETHGGAGARY
jgi:alkylation response protein AidB-like acyl-CoA dehydrogenase